MSKKVSVITVCYNAEASIANTLKSVLDQTFTDYEYVIVDGASKDNTLKIVEGYKAQFQQKGISLIVNSEKDNGIYDAMNKGISFCSGEWIIYLNADDKFSDPDVLKDIFGNNDFDGIDVIYGDSYRVKGDQKKLDLADKDLSLLRDFKFFCHQAAFTRRRVFDEIKFDCQFKICADYDFFLQAYLKNYKFHHENRIVCVYSVEGTSNKSYYNTILDNYNVRIKNGIIKKSWTIKPKAFIWNIKHTLNREW